MRVHHRRIKKRHIKLVLGLLLLGLTFLANRYPATVTKLAGSTPPGTYRVTQFFDGDTIAVDMNGKEEKIRMIGVDTPETHDPRKAVQCFGKAASDFTKQQIGNQPVRLEADPLGTNRDRYDRLLRYVYLPDGRLVQAEIIKQGYGFAYTSFPMSKADEFLSYQRLAREQGLGLWGSCQPSENQYGGYTSNDAQ